MPIVDDRPALAHPAPRRRAVASMSLAAATALVLSACAAPAATSTRVLDGGTIVYAHQQEPACVFGGWIEQAYLSYQVLDSLTSLEEDGTAVAWLAESWAESEDGLSWTFTLREDVDFTDGTPLDAQAVVANIRHWTEGGGNSTASVWLSGYLADAVAVDERTLRVDLAAPYPRLAETLSQGYFGIQSPTALETRTQEENCAAPIGSGAFTVEEWRRGQEIVLVRNDDYSSPPANARHQGPAHVERVIWKFIADPTTRVAALQSGEVDAIYDVPAVQWASLENGDVELLRHVTKGRPQQLTFDAVDGPFTDERVRQAFAHSLDRETIVETVGRGVIPFEGNGGVSAATPGYSQAAADRYDFDPELAVELLAEAGWLLPAGADAGGRAVREKEGAPLEVTLPYGAGSIISTDGAAILQGVKEQAEQVGFSVELVPVPQSEFFSGAYSTPEERDIAAGYWTAVTSGILWVNWRPSTDERPNYANQSFLADEELAELILAANSARDVDEQNRLYEQAQEHIADRAYSIGLFARLSTLAVGPRLQGVWQEHAQGGPVFHDAQLLG